VNYRQITSGERYMLAVLIRQYFPKGSSIHGINQPDRSLIADALNTKPRKRLNYRTAQECFDEG
jgi:IS30 family transposase